MKRETKSNKMPVNVLLKRLEKHKKEIGKQRDALRNLIDEAKAIYECCEDGVNSIEYAADVLSEYL